MIGWAARQLSPTFRKDTFALHELQQTSGAQARRVQLTWKLSVPGVPEASSPMVAYGCG
jgi:hypothetical protein